MTLYELLVVSVVGLPLVAALGATCDRVSGGRLLRPRYLARLAVWSIGLSACAAVVAAIATYLNPEARTIDIGTWIDTGTLRVPIGFLLDPLSATMAATISGLSWLVARFSVNYLHNEEGFGRYFTVLPLFVGAMLLLVLAENYLLLFLAWEVVGACSYLLIAFYRDRQSAVEAGTRAFVLNRVGDAGLLAGLFVLAVHGGSLSFNQVLSSTLTPAVATTVGLCLLAGAIGKSAQVPLGGWLSRAMEGPTPSSALIHGATMVTAGVYLVVRSAPVLEQAPLALVAVGVIGVATAVYGQLVGLTQTDIKGMLAASTNTHLGFMLLLCGLGLYPVAVFHLVAHAFYKTNLFLTAPSILHHLHGGPDPTAVGRPNHTARAGALVIGAVSIAMLAIPFAAEPLSLPETWARGGLAVGGLGAVAAFGLWFSTARMVSATFHQPGRNMPRAMVAVVCAAGLVVVGFLLGIQPGGLGGSWFARLLAPTVQATSTTFTAPPAATAWLTAALVALALSGLAVPRFLDRFREELPAGTSTRFARRLYFASINRAWLDELAERTTVALTLSGEAIDRFDRAVVDPITGSPLPLRGPAEGGSWEAKLRSAVQDSDSGVAESVRPSPPEWLLQPGHAPAKPAAGHGLEPTHALRGLSTLTTRMERRVISQGGGLYGILTQAVASLTGVVERVVIQRGIEGLFQRLTSLLALFTEGVERRIFQRGIEGLFQRLTSLLALFTEGVERRIFQLGPDRMIAGAGSSVRKSFLRAEAVLGRPAVAAAVAIACLIAVVVAG